MNERLLDVPDRPEYERGPSRLSRWRRATDTPLLVLAIGSVPLLMLELARHRLPYGDRLFLDIVNVVVFVAFAVDYVVGLALAERRRRYVRHEWPNLLIVVAQLLALLPGLTSVGVFRILRAGRALRIGALLLRVVAISGAASRDGRRVLRDHAASAALGLAGLTWLSSAVAFTFAEDVGTGGRLPSFFDALWWSMATITTVGYGDIYPVTGVGRLVASMTMIVGISAFAIVTAKIAEFLVRPRTEAEAEAVTEEVATSSYVS